MGILDALESLAGQGMQGQGSQEQVGQGDQAKVAGGLMQALQEHPGGIGGLLQSFQQNGMGEHVQQWSNGENQTATPEQVQQGLGGTGLVERTAEKAGVSPQVAQMAIAAILPMVIQHFAPGGQPSSQGAFGGLAQQMLSRFL